MHFENDVRTHTHHTPRDAMSIEMNAAGSSGAAAASEPFSCASECECENKPENWNSCVTCKKQMCDFFDAEHGWSYNESTEEWHCDDCAEKCGVCGEMIAEGDGGGECQFNSKCSVKKMHKDCGLLQDEEEDSDDEVWTCDNCNKCCVCEKPASDFIHACVKCDGLYCENCNGTGQDMCDACEYGRCDKCKKALTENFALLEEGKEPVKTCESCRK